MEVRKALTYPVRLASRTTGITAAVENIQFNGSPNTTFRERVMLGLRGLGMGIIFPIITRSNLEGTRLMQTGKAAEYHYNPAIVLHGLMSDGVINATLLTAVLAEGAAPLNVFVARLAVNAVAHAVLDLPLRSTRVYESATVLQ